MKLGQLLLYRRIRFGKVEGAAASSCGELAPQRRTVLENFLRNMHPPEKYNINRVSYAMVVEDPIESKFNTPGDRAAGTRH